MSKVEDFMAKLKQQQPKTKEDFKGTKRQLDKVYLNFPGNHGRYQVLPLNSAVTDYPFVTLFNTREVQILRKNIAADGTENSYKAWIKLLPKDAYTMKEQGTDRVVSSLTAAEEQLLSQAYMLYDQLFTELDAANNREAHITELIRKRNYTVFHGLCLNRWGMADARTPNRQNFSGLFVVTAKAFVNTIQNNIEETSLTEGGFDWLPQIYNNQLSGRTGFLMFSITPNPSQAGFLVSANHKTNAGTMLQDVVISEEDAALMKDPVGSFLGWQAKRDDAPDGYKRHFNTELINEVVAFLGEQLSAVRMAKSTGVDVAEAIRRTTDKALTMQQPTDSMGRTTNDPMLAKMSDESAASNFGAQGVIDPASVVNNNTQPYQTPPVAHIDPMTSSPTETAPAFGGNSPFETPSFAGNFGEGDGTNRPF